MALDALVAVEVYGSNAISSRSVLNIFPARPNKPAPDASKPLRDAKRELFAQRVASGVPVKMAYELSGYGGRRSARHDLRRAPSVEARINWLLESRIERDTARRHRSEKKIDDLRLRVLQELERIAFQDVRNVVQWDRQPQLSPEGDIIGIADELTITPSHRLSHEAAAAIKGVFTKGGQVRVELNDKLAALEKLAKATGLFQEAAPVPPSVTVNQVNITDNALETARRVGFLLTAMHHSANRAPAIIEGNAKASRE